MQNIFILQKDYTILKDCYNETLKKFNAATPCFIFLNIYEVSLTVELKKVHPKSHHSENWINGHPIRKIIS